MTETNDHLIELVHELRKELKELAERVARLENRPPSAAGTASPAVAETTTRTTTKDREALTTGGIAALFSRATAVTLILLFALVLRTLTDNGIIGLTAGSLVGLLYASLLEGVGFWLYRKRSPFAPIFSVSGALLLFAVVLETHSGFRAISSLTAYIILVVAASGMAVMSRIYGVALPVIVATVGILGAGLPLGFPDPDFLYLAIFLIAVNVMAFTADYLASARWLRILAFAATAMVYLAWSYKIYTVRMSGEAMAKAMAAGSFLPLITLMSAFYVFYVTWRIVRSENHRPDLFESLLPTLTTTWAYWLVRLFVTGYGSRVLTVVGGLGTLMAAALMGMAFFMARYREEGAPGTNTMVFPAAFLLALSFRDLSGESVVALTVLSAAAYLLTFLSVRWQSPGVRVTSYFLQAMVMGASLLLLIPDPPGPKALVTAAAMAAVAAFAFLHYLRVLRSEPPPASLFFGRIDRRDRSRVTPFLVALAAAYLMLRAVAFQVADGAMFQAAESVIINLGAAGLFLGARRTSSGEVRTVAKLVTALGAGKVFLFDLLRIKGLPVVLSVFSFGIAVAVGSLVLARWPGGEGKEEPAP